MVDSVAQAQAIAAAAPVAQQQASVQAAGAPLAGKSIAKADPAIKAPTTLTRVAQFVSQPTASKGSMGKVDEVARDLGQMVATPITAIVAGGTRLVVDVIGGVLVGAYKLTAAFVHYIVKPILMGVALSLPIVGPLLTLWLAKRSMKAEINAIKETAEQNKNQMASMLVQNMNAEQLEEIVRTFAEMNNNTKFEELASPVRRRFQEKVSAEKIAEIANDLGIDVAALKLPIPPAPEFTADVQDLLDAQEMLDEPAPVATQPAPVAVQPAPAAVQPAPVAARPAPVAAQPAQVAAQPAQVAAQPAQVAAQPAQVAAQPAPVATSAGRMHLDVRDKEEKAQAEALSRLAQTGPAALAARGALRHIAKA